ncbi:MAG TPA: thioredoxin domain-containing protein, partial [Rhizomicrobium sp.]|nr:thioredoxin domain-containing protein [Rhizomicrobium sp.]
MIPNSATSPYLLSHKDNPVQWRSWGPDARAEAKAQDKPILLSLGYAGCHWCHVMARESFADPEVAAFINENFIPVLVDRDERPDVDMLYQGAAGIMGHAGGWPLNIFLSHEGVPFWVAGYQSKEDRPDIPSFAKVARDTAALWRDDRARTEDTGARVKAAVENLYNRDMTQGQEPLNIDLSSLRVA